MPAAQLMREIEVSSFGGDIDIVSLYLAFY